MTISSYQIHVISSGRDHREVQAPRPFFTWLQRDWFLYRCTIHAHHLFVLFIPQIHYRLGLFLPRIPNNYATPNLVSFTCYIAYQNFTNLPTSFTISFGSARNHTNIWESFLSYDNCLLLFVVQNSHPTATRIEIHSIHLIHPDNNIKIINVTLFQQ